MAEKPLSARDAALVRAILRLTRIVSNYLLLQAQLSKAISQQMPAADAKEVADLFEESQKLIDDVLKSLEEAVGYE
jgi:hypothetical protein